MSNHSVRFIVLTGSPGCGKTTLVKKVCADLKERSFVLNGFFTEEIRTGTERVGFDVVPFGGIPAPLARLPKSGDLKKPSVGKYSVDVKSFELSVLPVLAPEDENSILVIDEIGKMELLSERFKNIVCELINSKKHIILATVPLKTRFISVVEMIKSHPNTRLITVTNDNRNSLLEEIINLILSAKEENWFLV